MIYFGKGKKQIYPKQTITDDDSADDIALLANTPTWAESLLLSLERSAGNISLHVYADKTKLMCYNQRGDISTLNGWSLKNVDKFTYLEHSVSSTKSDINTYLAKAWAAIYGLSIIKKPDLLNKIKQFFLRKVVSMDAPHGSWLSVWIKSLKPFAQGIYERHWTNPGGNISKNSSFTATYQPSWKPSIFDEQYMWDTFEEVRAST